MNKKLTSRYFLNNWYLFNVIKLDLINNNSYCYTIRPSTLSMSAYLVLFQLKINYLFLKSVKYRSYNKLLYYRSNIFLTGKHELDWNTLIFSNINLDLLLMFKATNFFFSIRTNKYISLFSKNRKLKKMEVESKSLNTLRYATTTISSGMTDKNKKSQLKFDNFSFSRSLVVWSLSVFWTYMSIFNPYFFSHNLTITLKGQVRWVKSIISCIRGSFYRIRKNYFYYIISERKKKRKNRKTKFLGKHFFYSLKRFNLMCKLPLYFNSIKIHQMNSHNGCKTKKLRKTKKI